MCFNLLTSADSSDNFTPARAAAPMVALSPGAPALWGPLSAAPSFVAAAVVEGCFAGAGDEAG